MSQTETARRIIQRARLWNHSTAGSKVEEWTKGDGAEWILAPASQLRLLYAELRPCETLGGLLSKLDSFEKWVRSRGKGRSVWEKNLQGQSLLQRLGLFLVETVREATAGNDGNVILFKSVGSKDSIDDREFAIAWEVLDLLKMKHQSAREEAQAK